MAAQQLSRIFLPSNLKKQLRDRVLVIEFKTQLVRVYKAVLWLSVAFGIALSVWIYFSKYLEFYKPMHKLMVSASAAAILFFALYALFWFIFITYINLKLYYRTRQIEVFLPDYLGFTAANLRAGMSIDKALWLAIRPRFGPLAKEMEIVAKSTMSGEDLAKALTKFANKYESKMLRRSVSLLNEGLNAGGRISDLISKIAWNLDEVEIIQKEISANVANYVIFITFATVIAAPLLFALCSMLLYIITGLQTIIGPAATAASAQPMPVKFLQSGISMKDFNIYAELSLATTSLFSSMIISIIRKGNIKDGLKYVPIFIAASFALFIIGSKILQLMFSGMF